MECWYDNGASKTITVERASILVANATFDVKALGNDTVTGTLNVDGAAQTPEAVLHADPEAGFDGLRGTVSQSYVKKPAVHAPHRENGRQAERGRRIDLLHRRRREHRLHLPGHSRPGTLSTASDLDRELTRLREVVEELEETPAGTITAEQFEQLSSVYAKVVDLREAASGLA